MAIPSFLVNRVKRKIENKVQDIRDKPGKIVSKFKDKAKTVKSVTSQIRSNVTRPRNQSRAAEKLDPKAIKQKAEARRLALRAKGRAREEENIGAIRNP